MIDAALTDDSHGRRIDWGTGSRRSSFAEAVEELADATGRRLRYMRVSSERYAALLAAQDVPDDLVARLRRVIDTVVETATLRHPAGVERAIERQPRDLADFARPTASTAMPATASRRSAAQPKCDVSATPTG